MRNAAKYTLVAVIAFCLGAGAVWYYQQEPEPRPQSFGWNDKFLDDMFNDDFFRRSRDPFREMERLREQINKYFDRNSSRFESMFDDWFSGQFGDYPATAIAMNEDDEHIYYEMEVGDSDVTNIDVQIENGMIEIKAVTESSSRPGERSYAEINQRFPLPPGVDPATLEVNQEGETIVISLRKTG